jgi:hypothetical protein
MAAAVTAIEALREHGKAGVARNLAAAGAIHALKTSLDHGDFGRFCDDTLQISASYRARLLNLNKVREHVSSAQAWAATQKHRLAECQSAQNLIKLVHDWLKRDEPPKPKTASRTQDAQPGKEGSSETESVVQEDAALIAEREKTLSDLKAELANKNDALTDLRRSLTECERDFVTLHAFIPFQYLRSRMTVDENSKSFSLSKLYKLGDMLTNSSSSSSPRRFPTWPPCIIHPPLLVPSYRFLL